MAITSSIGNTFAKDDSNRSQCAMSYLQKHAPPPLDIESPGTRDDQKLLGSPFDKLAPMIIGGHDPGYNRAGNGMQQTQGSPVSPTSPLVYCPRSPSLGRK
ncbi:hypothetical protein quinque_000363 [Culex quinquefasciatus]